VMNIVGPLANPAMCGRQLVGVADERRVPLLAGALSELGTRHALVVHGTGMDEISPLAPTRVVEIHEGHTKEWIIDPREFGYDGLSAADLAGGPPAANAEAVLAVLGGKSNRASRAAVALNAAAAIYVSGKTKSLTEGVKAAEQAIDSGAGLQALERLRTAFAASASAP
jgi:anthranilate phosphoribosyltransferase